MSAVAWLNANQGAILAVSTVVVAVAVILLWFTALGLLRSTKKQVDGLKRIVEVADASVTAAAMSAQAARQTLQTMHDMSERPLRAYVSVNDAYISNATGKTPPTISLELRNFGQTPAYDLKWQSSYAVKPEPDGEPLTIQQETPPSASALFAGMTVSKTVILPGWKAEYGEMIATQKAAVYASGEISYTDAFGKKRRTAYRLKHGGSQGVRAEKLLPAEHGNEAD